MLDKLKSICYNLWSIHIINHQLNYFLYINLTLQNFLVKILYNALYMSK